MLKSSRVTRSKWWSSPVDSWFLLYLMVKTKTWFPVDFPIIQSIVVVVVVFFSCSSCCCWCCEQLLNFFVPPTATTSWLLGFQTNMCFMYNRTTLTIATENLGYNMKPIVYWLIHDFQLLNHQFAMCHPRSMADWGGSTDRGGLVHPGGLTLQGGAPFGIANLGDKTPISLGFVGDITRGYKWLNCGLW